jgi:hypothetical protein
MYEVGNHRFRHQANVTLRLGTNPDEDEAQDGD